MPSQELRGQRIAITGASGFIGSALVARLQAASCELELISRRPSVSAASIPGIRRSVLNLATPESWREILSRNDFVIHLSAQSDLYRAEKDPAESEVANVVPVEALLTAARTLRGHPRKVVMASTATIVGLNESNPVDDLVPDRPITVYDCHKKRCEELLARGAESGFLQACSLRLANVFGFGVPSTNNNRGFLNAMIHRAVAGIPISLYGRGEFVRDFIHVDDVVDAFCRAVAAPIGHDGSHYLIASGVGHTLRQAMDVVCEEVKRVTGKTTNIAEIQPPAGLHSIERRNFVGDSTRFGRLTGWRCGIELRIGIRRFVQRVCGANSAESVLPALDHSS